MSLRIFYDTESTGHHGEFLENLISGLPDSESKNSIILCNPLLGDRLISYKRELNSSVRIILLDQSDINCIESSLGVLQRAKKELSILENYINKSKASAVIFMHINIHQIALFTWSYAKKNNIELSGILFNPLTLLSRIQSLENKLSVIFPLLRKMLQLALMLSNKSLKKVFILNDDYMARKLNNWFFKANLFESIVDPKPSRFPDIEVPHISETIAGKPFVFLLAGVISPRKGGMQVIKALQLLNLEKDKKVLLRIVGRFSDKYSEYNDRLFSEIDRLNASCKNIEGILRNDYISNEDLSNEFATADCILAPYIKFYGSSGMIGHACRYKKPLLVSHDGLIGEIIREYQLGLSVNPSDIQGLSRSLKDIIAEKFEYSKANAQIYLNQASHFEFARKLIS